MAIQGKNSISYKKENVKEQNTPSVGVKNLAFAHEFANAGEDAVLFNSLIAPLEWNNSGLQNPNGTTLLSSHLEVFKKNVTVSSSVLSRTFQKNEYVVKNSGIYFKTHTSTIGEIIEVEVSDILVTGPRLVDVKNIRVETEMLSGNTDVVIGDAVNVFDEEVVVFRNGVQVFRSDDNDSSGLTGNYYYINPDGDGFSNTIRFFEESTWDEPILIYGNIVDSPNLSTFQMIETVAGQVDALVQTVAASESVPESTFQVAPNNVDLRTFGNRVLALEQAFNALMDKLDSDTGVNDTDYNTLKL